MVSFSAIARRIGSRSPLTRISQSLVEKTIVEFKPHVVFAQLNQAREILALAKRYGCRTALYVLDVDHEENFLALESEPDLIFAVSDFTRGELSRRFGKESHVLYPLVDVRSLPHEPAQ